MSCGHGRPEKCQHALRALSPNSYLHAPYTGRRGSHSVSRASGTGQQPRTQPFLWKVVQEFDIFSSNLRSGGCVGVNPSAWLL